MFILNNNDWTFFVMLPNLLPQCALLVWFMLNDGSSDINRMYGSHRVINSPRHGHLWWTSWKPKRWQSFAHEQLHNLKMWKYTLEKVSNQTSCQQKYHSDICFYVSFDTCNCNGKCFFIFFIQFNPNFHQCPTSFVTNCTINPQSKLCYSLQ